MCCSLQAAEIEKKEKVSQEQQSDESRQNDSADKPDDDDDETDSEHSFTYKDQMFSIGDFVYIEPR